MNITQVEYEKLFKAAIIGGIYKKVAEIAAQTIIEHKQEYTQIANATGVPFYVIGLIHYREASFNFKRHLHNGDSLAQRTIHVPVGRPITGNPPFTFVESAIDALNLDGFTKNKDWTLGNTLYLLERFNGGGYLKRNMYSPYLWSGIPSLYIKGKYASDGRFDPNLVDKQLGAATILKALDIYDNK